MLAAWPTADPRFLALAVVAVLVPLLLTIGRGIRDVVELNRGLALYQSFGMPADTIPVLIPCYGRPHYLEQVLDALRKAHNVDKVRMTRARLRRARAPRTCMCGAVPRVGVVSD